MATWQPDEPVACPISRQRWDSLAFLHWPYEPEIVQSLLPPGLDVDVFDDKAWVGLTPFLMRDFRLPPLPGLPGWSTFPETNLRTYVRGRGGLDGLWFFSLECHRLIPVAGIRGSLGLPYRWADMTVRRHPGEVLYQSHRRPPHADRPATRVRLELGTPLAEREVSELEVFLVGRWRAYTHAFGQLALVPVEHQPWPLAHARVVELQDELVPSAGLPPPRDPPLVHFSPGVDVAIGRPRLAR